MVPIELGGSHGLFVCSLLTNSGELTSGTQIRSSLNPCSRIRWRCARTRSLTVIPLMLHVTPGTGQRRVTRPATPVRSPGR